MDKSDVGRIFRLLLQFRRNAPQLKDPDFRLAWELGLAPYDYEDVKAAVVAYVRKNSFFPNLSDIVAHLTPQDAPEPVADTRYSCAEMDRYIDALFAKPETEGMRISRYAREHGISWEEAENLV